jgi:hypothetical protein
MGERYIGRYNIYAIYTYIDSHRKKKSKIQHHNPDRTGFARQKLQEKKGMINNGILDI